MRPVVAATLRKDGMADEVNHGRRGFLRGQVRPATPPLRPPWAQAEAAFLQACTRCRNCAVICPTRVIHLVDGYPEVSFTGGQCTFCGECVRVCAPGALRRREDEPPWSCRARISDACIAQRGVECRVCGEQCEAGAIRFLPQIGGVSQPAIDAAACSGCGACVAPCPSAAIRVR